jgi:endoglucanase Acf2
VLQGWLPHHYRDTENNLKMTGDQYLSPRGTLKLSAGNDFHITYRFHGLLPFLPAARASGLPYDYSEQRMRDYIKDYSARTDYGDDTYWGGKSLTQFGQYMSIAAQMGDPRSSELQSSLTHALTDWYTYTPGEKSHYFARYDNWHALIGFNTSYGTEGFNDNHFHYGYFTTATALLGFQDPKFLNNYGSMAKLVAKEYANWDRTDQSFPYFRTFDIWEGHSWAGGFSSGNGNNQESSSEAAQSWYGLFLLGSALNDPKMQAAGAMGYSMETTAAREYWFDVHQDNHSLNWKHPMTGMVWGGGNNYGTYFSGDPVWIYGINCLPVSPGLEYIAEDQPYSANLMHTMIGQPTSKGTLETVSSMGAALGNVILGAASIVDPDWAAEQEDELWKSGDPVMHNNDTAGLSYYYTAVSRNLGPVAWTWRTSAPLSNVFHNPKTGATKAVIYNSASVPEQVTVYNNDKPAGATTVPARTLLTYTVKGN